MKTPKPHPTTKRPDREFDTTSLKASGPHGQYVHRDYAAHWFRWGYSTRFCREGMRVLDVGCGTDQMLAMCLRRSLSFVPELYVGIDIHKLGKKTDIAWTLVLDEFDFTRRHGELLKYTADIAAKVHKKEHCPPGPFDVVTCFEVIEHMKPEAGLRLLRGIRAVMKPEGVALLSTPVYNGKHMAANHIHEYEYGELREFIARAGLEVERVHGTFMPSTAIKKVATPEERALVEELAKWYTWDVLANFLAPKYPEASSNCCWVLRRKS